MKAGLGLDAIGFSKTALLVKSLEEQPGAEFKFILNNKPHRKNIDSTRSDNILFNAHLQVDMYTSRHAVFQA